MLLGFGAVWFEVNWNPIRLCFSCTCTFMRPWTLDLNSLTLGQLEPNRFACAWAVNCTFMHSRAFQSSLFCNLLCQGDLRNGPKIWTLSINTHKPIIQPWHVYTAPSLNLETVKESQNCAARGWRNQKQLVSGEPKKKGPNKDLSINIHKPFRPWQKIHASSPKSGTCKESLNCMDS